MLLTVDIGNTHIIIGGFQIKDKSVAQTPSFIARFLTEHRENRRPIRHGNQPAVIPVSY